MVVSDAIATAGVQWVTVAEAEHLAELGSPWPVDGDATALKTPGHNVSPQTPRQPQGRRELVAIYWQRVKDGSHTAGTLTALRLLWRERAQA